MKKRISNTCIAVAEYGGNIYMAGDRRVSWGMDQAQSMPVPKVQKRDGMLIGATGVSSICDAIVSLIKYPAIKKRMKPADYMNTVVRKAILDHFTSIGMTRNGRIVMPDTYSCEAVFVIGGKCFSVEISNEFDTDADDSSFHIIDIAQNSLPYATGCGGQWAWGVLEEHASLISAGKLKLRPEESMRRALKIAGKFSPGCDTQIDIINDIEKPSTGSR